MKNKNALMVTVALVIIGVFIGAYFVISSKIDANYMPNYLLEDFVPFPEKSVGINEYKIVSVTEEDMVKTYFNTFTSMMIENPAEAYDKLDEESKLDLYKNLNSFNIKVNFITVDYTIIPVFDSYSVTSDEEGRTVYIVKDKRNNIYRFTTDAIMKYTVALD